MKRKYLFANCIIAFCSVSVLYGQAAPPVSGGSISQSREEAVQVNPFTGIPSISIPVFNYEGQNGIKLNMSLDYYAGGIKLNEPPSSAGLGWNLNTGGYIVRTVRGKPDDIDWTTFLFSPCLPADTRNFASRYFYAAANFGNVGTWDAEQDVFQFNINGRAGKFYIGKNKKIITVPASKLKITYSRSFVIDDVLGTKFNGVWSVFDTTTINSFTITAEDGVKYIFDNVEYEYYSMIPAPNGATRGRYPSAWYLSKIISPFNTDTLTFSYIDAKQSFRSIFQTDTLSGVVNKHSDSSSTSGTVAYAEIKLPSLITLPGNKTVSFIYNNPPDSPYNAWLQTIRYNDSVFRYGYIFKWDTAGIGINKGRFLTGLNYFTAIGEAPGFAFKYNTPAIKNSPYTIKEDNRKDHWGYYNGANNSNDFVPTVSGVYTGANRTPSSLAVAGTIASITNPFGGKTYYQFENNDVQPSTIAAQTISVDASSATQTSISINQLFSTYTNFRIIFNNTFYRLGTLPFTGGGSLTYTVTNTAGTVTYATGTVSLFDIFYKGMGSITANIPNGSCLFKTSLTAGTTATGALPLVITWNNQSAASGNTSLVGGVRIKQISRFDPVTNTTDTVSTYKYVLTSGKSSGFIGNVPLYSYTYPTVNYATNPGVITSTQTIISSEAINDFDFTGGGSAGYSRVEVLKGSAFRNLGKEVYEYTDLQDAGLNMESPAYPYVPVSKRQWAVGLPRRIYVYDSTGTKMQVTTNTYSVVNTLVADTNFASVRFGNAINNGAGSGQSYTGQLYYPETGWTSLTNSVDSFFHPNGSSSVSQKSFQYDTNYNLIKTITDYDKTRGLSLEKRLYYPYNYTLGGVIGKLKDSGIYAIVSSEDWITGDATPRILSAQISDFVQLGTGHVKPLAIYALQANTPVPQATIGSFSPSLLVRNSSYFIKQQDFTQYSSIGNLLETSSALTGQPAAMIYDYAGSRITAAISNAKIADAAYSSFEDSAKGNWSYPDSGAVLNSGITGSRSYNLTKDTVRKTGLTASVTYIISYWKTGGGTVSITNAQNVTSIATQNGWTLYTQTLSGQTSVTISGTAVIDELRLYPEDANMQTTTWHPVAGISSTCDANSTITYYEYDFLNRLKTVRDKDRNVIKKYELADSAKVISVLPNWVLTGDQHCELPFNGKIDKQEIDINPYSTAFNTTRYTAYADCVTCPPACPVSPNVKLVNCVCETGIKVYTSSVYKKINGVFQWECTYHWCWSDHSISGNYTEVHASSCTVADLCAVD